MKTHLSLRRRLLRLEDTVPLRQDTTTSSLLSILHSNPVQTIPEQLHPQNDDTETKRDEDEEDEGTDDERDDLETDESGTPFPSGTRYQPAARVKLLFSRRQRPPTVWFEYPTSLGVTREYNGQIVTTVDAQKLRLFYRADWERNCVKAACAAAGLVRTRAKWSTWHLAWAKPGPVADFQKLRGASQVFNHFPDPWIIGRKDRLLHLLATYRRRFPKSFDFFPHGFSLPNQLDAFRRALAQNDLESSRNSTMQSLWILKPPASACGRGIRLLTPSAARQLCERMRTTLTRGTVCTPRIVQHYVANPLLLGPSPCYKFDLRLYVLVTTLDPLRIYLFQEGLVRFCTSPYSLANVHDRFAHLTNSAIHTKQRPFLETTDANARHKWRLSALLCELQRQALVKDPEEVMHTIRGIICKTIIAAEATLTPLLHQWTDPHSCFELFGFDLMLDAEMRPWLIEVNVSPSIMGGSPLDRQVKGVLLSDTFHLVGLQVPVVRVPRGDVPVELQLLPISSSSDSRYPFRRSQSVRPTRKLHQVVQNVAIDRFTAKHLELFTATDWDIVHTMDDEMDRRGHFDRIFPAASRSETASYAQFFTCPRYANLLCMKWLQTPRTVRQRVVRHQAAGSGRPLSH